MDLKEKVAVVTGAAQGLGRSFVEILLKNERWASNCVTVEKRLKERNCSWSSDLIVFSEGVLCLSQGGVVRGTYLALEHMKKENGGNGGVIVNVSSMAGLGPFPMAPIYTATKHGVVGFSRAMAAVSKLANYGVRINILCPWFVKTNLLSSMNSEEHIGSFFPLKGITETMMQKRGCLEADVVAKAFLVLVKDESKNGDVLMIDPDEAVFISLPERAKDFPSTPVSLE
uniref:Zgc:56585 n=1 Tax=Cyprinus carpio TaxID=7962 RepID=A0A8C1VUU2_CYPCA